MSTPNSPRDSNSPAPTPETPTVVDDGFKSVKSKKNPVAKNAKVADATESPPPATDDQVSDKPAVVPKVVKPSLHRVVEAVAEKRDCVVDESLVRQILADGTICAKCAKCGNSIEGTKAGRTGGRHGFARQLRVPRKHVPSAILVIYDDDVDTEKLDWFRWLGENLGSLISMGKVLVSNHCESCASSLFNHLTNQHPKYLRDLEERAKIHEEAIQLSADNDAATQSLPSYKRRLELMNTKMEELMMEGDFETMSPAMIAKATSEYKKLQSEIATRTGKIAHLKRAYDAISKNVANHQKAARQYRGTVAQVTNLTSQHADDLRPYWCPRDFDEVLRSRREYDDQMSTYGGSVRGGSVRGDDDNESQMWEEIPARRPVTHDTNWGDDEVDEPIVGSAEHAQVVTESYAAKTKARIAAERKVEALASPKFTDEEITAALAEMPAEEKAAQMLEFRKQMAVDALTRAGAKKAGTKRVASRV